MGVKRRRCRDCVRVDAFFFRNSLVHRRDLDVTTGVTGKVTAGVEVTDSAAAPSGVVVGAEVSEALASGGGGAEVSDGVGVAGSFGVGVTGGFVVGVGGRGGSEENQSITVCAFQVGM